ncbi:MurR/RpiR family transcriptional regulator [Aquamicrobium sp. LC103]|uniref:MurR/RpiR family transcriptional regulator n=1 Tax=Aquamicrobium sp. LC103 TaxID=1120658 RepID=UPI00063ECE24|nr:MurR/RpiR family transcriptional regulator [Aquamicrobium sp. LC103]TKT76102.1 MurR/RpiR family transcriptional regulator [Aquamicrobium sp. LC103]
MRHQASLIDRLRMERQQLNRADRAVADAVLEDIEAATRISIKELASRAKVSEPTVIRFSRRMGCDGFSDFKIRLAQDYAIGRMYIAAERTSPAETGREVADQVYEATSQALASAFAQRDPAALEKAAELIHRGRRIFCFGVGGSSANVALEAENRFFRLDIAVSATADSYKHRVIASTADPQDVLLIFSVTGKPRSLVDSAEIAVELGASVVAVTDPTSPLAAKANVVVPLVAFDEEKFFYMPNRGRYGQLFVLDCLATLVGAWRRNAVAKKLWRARSNLVSLHGNTDSQPVGD